MCHGTSGEDATVCHDTLSASPRMADFQSNHPIINSIQYLPRVCMDIALIMKLIARLGLQGEEGEKNYGFGTF
jgi:hypothetical protein